MFIGIVAFLMLLAVFDLTVGVSNDAVNFLNSAIGSKAASLKHIIMIASVGVFIGAAMSNGMMDIARHGIFRPEMFTFREIICIFMAVMVTDIILLDIFNMLALPTSTTVSMVFELLGATFAVAVVKVSQSADGLDFAQLLNTDKALSVILGIFLSVAIAFVFGIVVQFLTRMWLTFDCRSRLKWRAGLFCGVAMTAIVYFLLLKGVKDLSFMTPDIKAWIADNTAVILLVSLAVLTVLMQALHWLGVNVLKVVVLTGTFALAMAFAGNDLVNFIGVPLTGLSALQDFMAHGGGSPDAFTMGSLNGPSDTSPLFLLGAGVIMVIALATSRKARNVSKTEVGLGSQSAGDEMFGSSRVARHLVRASLNAHSWVCQWMPAPVLSWLGRRFDTRELTLEQGAQFDLVRAAINFTLAGSLIAAGTSLKLPLSTTFVTFMVAMGTSLSDRAWGRESAVFRVTGVISVIGGWFITAGAAFFGAAIVVALMLGLGNVMIVGSGVVAVIFLVNSNIRYSRRQKEEKGDVAFQTLLGLDDQREAWRLFLQYMGQQQQDFLEYAYNTFRQISTGFMDNDIKALRHAERSLRKEKELLKASRRKQTLCFCRMDKTRAIEKSTWFHLANNSMMAMSYNLRHINEVCIEHVDNNFRPLQPSEAERFAPLSTKVVSLLALSMKAIADRNAALAADIRQMCHTEEEALARLCREVYDTIPGADSDALAITYVYINTLQETQMLLSGLRKLMRSSVKMG